MKRIAIIVNFYNGKRTKDVVNPLTWKLLGEGNAPRNNPLKITGPEDVTPAGSGRALPEMSENHKSTWMAVANPDSKTTRQSRSGC